jgi:hypothetical protein
MQHHVALTAGTPWSSQGRVSVASMVRMLKALLKRRLETTHKATGIHKGLSVESENNMEQSQIQLIKDQTFLNLRARIAQILLDQQILDTHNDSVGWWSHSGGTSTWVSLYDVLEEARD